MNFGQALDLPAERVTQFELTAELSDLSSTFRDLADLKADYERFPDDADPYDSWAPWMIAHGWPPLEFVADRAPEVLRHLLLDLGYDVLIDLERAHEEPLRYGLNSVEAVQVDGHRFTLRGETWRVA